MSRRVLCVLSCVCLVWLEGCIRALAFMADGELAAARTLAIEGVEIRAVGATGRAAGLAEVRIGGSALRARRMAITAEEIGVFSRSTAAVRAGRLISGEEAAFNASLGRIRLVRTPGGNPRLFMRGAEEAFAEVLPHEGRLRLFNGNSVPLHSTIYSVEGPLVVVRTDPVVAPGNVLVTLRQGDMVIKLAEEKGWYQVQALQAGRELTGFVELLLLAAVVLGGSDDDKKERSPSVSIAAETRSRWDYYWARIGGNDVPEFTAQDAMALLHSDYGRETSRRSTAFSEAAWPEHVDRFVRMDQENLPILSAPDFNDSTLRVLGFTKAGELLEFLERADFGVKLVGPGDWRPKNFGEWYRVRTIEGAFGWVFTRPYGQGYSSGTLVERCHPNSLVLWKNSEDLYRVTIDGVRTFNMKGSRMRNLGPLPPGVYTVRVKQLDGFILFPTERRYEVNLPCGVRASVSYP